MATNFPDSPSTNDTHTVGDLTWIFDGTVWKLTVPPSLAPAGSTTQVQYNSSGSFAGSANFTFDGTSTVTLASTDAGSSAAPIIELYRNSSSPADADYLGQIKFQGEDDGGAKVNYAKITAKIDDASNTTEDGIIEIAHMKAGSNNISARFTSSALKLINGTGLEVADGLLTLGSTAVTATAAELNIMDGVTSTTAELNILDGVTSTAAELNILDGVTSTTAELNILDGVTSTAAELNLVDGITAGTVAASKAVIVDSNKDISGFRNITSTGDATIGDTLILTGNAVSHISNNTSSNREILQLRGKTALSDGAGINVYGGGDSDFAEHVKMWTNNTERFVLDNSGNLLLKAGSAVLTIADTAANNDQNDVQSTIFLRGRYHSGTADPLADTYSDAKIELLRDNSDGTGGSTLKFSTSATSAGGLTEKLRITKARTIIAHTEDVTGSAETGCLILGDPAGTHIAFDNNEIMGKDSATSASPLYLQNVNDNGAHLRIGNYDSGNGDYIEWNGETDDLVFHGDSFLDFDGTNQSASNQLIDFPHGYTLNVDNAGNGTDNSRIWIHGPEEGECVIGPRVGANSFDRVRLRADTIRCEGAITKFSGSFEIPHPTKGGDWRLRHSFIEGPTCDNIYRGTATLDGGSATIDLDTVSNMTDGTWEALNTNPWSMASSSGNAITWSLSGKILTIEGPDGAVCSWMVIGERKDPSIVKSRLTDDNGKLITEYEKPEEDPDDVAGVQEEEPLLEAEEGEQ
jgi:hypothetical protein